MRILLSLLALSPAVSVARHANGTHKQVFDERFALYERSCMNFCQEDLTHPVNGLSWTNVHSVPRRTPFSDIPGVYHPMGQLPPFAQFLDPNQYWFGIYTGEAINVTKPTVATSYYNGSCVKHWELSSLALGCNIETINFDHPFLNSVGPANCTIMVEGFDSKGNCVGHEFYSYHGVLVDTFLQFNWFESTYNTTKGGLKGKKLRSLSIMANVTYNPRTQRNPELGIGDVEYTVFNRTKCS